jgi:hypothetical protein
MELSICDSGESAVRLTSPLLAGIFALLFTMLLASSARASDHLDSPATVANPQIDVADMYAWTSADGQRLNLVMTVLGHSFSTKAQYVLHVDSGGTFGHTTGSVPIECTFASVTAVECKLGDADVASGDPTDLSGLKSRDGLFRVYAGLRDDPFYNNIKGLLDAYGTASNAIKNGAAVDAAGCAHFDDATTKEILDHMQHTDGGPAENFLGNWTVSAIVISVELSAVSKGGKLLAVWGETTAGGKTLDHMARPFVANTLLGVAPFSPDDPSGLRRQEYNEVSRTGETAFVADLQKSLAFQDSLDGKCGNQVLAQPKVSPSRYMALAKTFADDRLWVNSASKVCTQFFAVELTSLAGRKNMSSDCGGRAPTYDAPNSWRSLLIAGATTGITDGLSQDEHAASATAFPFLAAPDANGIDH